MRSLLDPIADRRQDVIIECVSKKCNLSDQIASCLEPKTTLRLVVKPISQSHEKMEEIPSEFELRQLLPITETTQATVSKVPDCNEV